MSTPFDELTSAARQVPAEQRPIFVLAVLRRLTTVLPVDEVPGIGEALSSLLNSLDAATAAGRVTRVVAAAGRRLEAISAEAHTVDPQERTAYLLMAFDLGLGVIAEGGDVEAYLGVVTAAMAEHEYRNSPVAARLQRTPWPERHDQLYQLPSLAKEMGLLEAVALACAHPGDERGLVRTITHLMQTRTSLSPRRAIGDRSL